MRTLSLLLALFAACGGVSVAEEIQIAAAADLEYAFKDIARHFEHETQTTVRLSFESSGNLTTQIENGAPYDLFFSADTEYPKKLAADGLAESGSLYPYAAGKLVLWVRNDSRLDLRQGLAALLQPSVETIAIANPAHAPYGRVAMAALKSGEIYAQIRNKLVFGENISQTAQFVQSGNADVAVLALSLALSPAMKGQGRYFLIPASSYPALIQSGCILRSSKNKEVAQRFIEFLKSPEGIKVMQQYGFEQPGSGK